MSSIRSPHRAPAPDETIGYGAANGARLQSTGQRFSPIWARRSSQPGAGPQDGRAWRTNARDLLVNYRGGSPTAASGDLGSTLVLSGLRFGPDGADRRLGGSSGKGAAGPAARRPSRGTRAEMMECLRAGCTSQGGDAPLSAFPARQPLPRFASLCRSFAHSLQSVRTFPAGAPIYPAEHSHIRRSDRHPRRAARGRR